jgi:hypothetical protein
VSVTLPGGPETVSPATATPAGAVRVMPTGQTAANCVMPPASIVNDVTETVPPRSQ